MITIHMTTYKRFANGLLPAAVDSVLSQSFKDFEFIICDDASYDGTAAYLHETARRDARVKVIRNPRNVNSVSISLGRCMKAASPARPYLTWMFDDCVLRPDALKIIYEAMRNDPKLDFLFGVTLVHLQDGGVLPVGDKAADYIKKHITESSILVPNAGILFKTSVFDRIGWYDSNIILRRSTDWDLFRRIITADVPFAVIPDVLSDEYGDTQPDSLRNTFATSFHIMAKFGRVRDSHRPDLSLDACLSDPVDSIPEGNWTEEELELMRFMFLEYFLSVADTSKAFFWARTLYPVLPNKPFFLENLLRLAASEDGSSSRMAAGAFGGVVFALSRARLLAMPPEKYLAIKEYLPFDPAVEDSEAPPAHKVPGTLERVGAFMRRLTGRS